MIENKKVLVLSISAWNSRVGSNTWPTLLGNLNPENIANIALREETPDSEASNHYFVISENRVIKSILKRRIQTGKRLERGTTGSSDDLASHNRRYRIMKDKRGFFTLLARELVWKLGKWKTKELDAFVQDFQPDIVLYFMDGYPHFNRLCRYVKKKTGAKSIGFFVDDNFTYKQPVRLGSKVFRFFQQHALKKLAKKTDAFWAITDKTKQEADAFFDINCTVVTKPLSGEPVYEDWQVNHPIRVLYTGNLQINRDKSLVKVVNVLKTINQNIPRFQVDVYTKTELSETVKQQLACGFCTVHAAVPQHEVLEKQKQADILLFLEDIDGVHAKTARLSFSTKITDYLSSGKSIFAVGCLDTAPMQYFKENDIGIVATTEQEMVEQFERIVDNPELLKQYAKRAYEYGIGHHSKEKILKIVHDSMEQLL